MLLIFMTNTEKHCSLFFLNLFNIENIFLQKILFHTFDLGSFNNFLSYFRIQIIKVFAKTYHFRIPVAYKEINDIF
jgi:hypothetical protein